LKSLNSYIVDKLAEVGGINAYIICQVLVWDKLQDMRASFYGNVLSTLQGFWGRILVPAAQQETAQENYARFRKEFEGH
jgi:hypothetical protein